MRTKSKLAQKKVMIISGKYKGKEYWVENWWENVGDGSWMFANGNPACMKYAIRVNARDDLPLDNDVLYGKIGGLGELIHISEVIEEQAK